MERLALIKATDLLQRKTSRPRRRKKEEACCRHAGFEASCPDEAQQITVSGKITREPSRQD
jgi:hypothetical protein